MNAEQIKKFKDGKTETQIKVIDYFTKTGGCGCMGKTIKDDEYLKLVHNQRDSLKTKERAFSKIGLDVDQVKEIPPVTFEGFRFKDAWAKKTAKGSWVSSSYQVAWLFFSDSQVYIYQHTFHMDEDKKSERTDEFFYKDVTSFSTTSESEKARAIGDKEIDVENNMLAMVVPGDKFMIALSGVEGSEAVIQAMKQKLREKKSR